ncbi:uncharacterized protein LOC126736724 [Anthonomus grandis grandis]|uniref:uncharacterized protein LOC126736724 n=1 Tax=Anthonomus grandis grandis TaxID=2921223 RepID=UPI00216634D2|nr:uncharacterized protein LOC126736724 [Anthonomus grandis grandis]
MGTFQRESWLYFGDKDVDKVSGVWKALHITIYIVIAINAFVTSMAAGNMFQTFKYNCILYCTNITFEQEFIPRDSIISPPIHKVVLRDVSSEELLLFNDTLNSDDTNSTYTDYGTDYGNTSLVTSTERSIEVESVIFKNDTHVFKNAKDSIKVLHARIDVRKSLFPAGFWCHFVLSVALITFIFGTFCTVILAMCSKGGKGRNNTLNRPQNMVYPIIVSSVLLGVLNLIGAIIVKNGMQEFCASFELFTDTKSCSSLINKFTLHERQGNFYLPYIVLANAFNITVILFLGQLIVTILRVVYAVDYQLYATELPEDDEEPVIEVEDGRVVIENGKRVKLPPDEVSDREEAL